MTLEATHQGNYIDDGATCSDQVDGVIPQNVEVSGDVVNLSKVGTYTITYNCKDSANNAAPAAQRTVVVAQTSCPKCTVHGTDVVHEASFPYSDAGASCSDVIDGDVTTLCFTASYGTDGGVAAAGTKEDQFAGGATWTGKGYCDEMEGQTNAACSGMTRTDCTGTASCKWNQYSACDTSAAGSNNLITDAAVQGTTNSGAQIGTYYITYRAKNTVGLYNDGANCRGGAIEYIRKVEVKDTLRPVITLKYDSGSGDATVAQGDPSPTDAATADLSLSDTASDKQYPSVTGAYASQGNVDRRGALLGHQGVLRLVVATVAVVKVALAGVRTSHARVLLVAGGVAQGKVGRCGIGRAEITLGHSRVARTGVVLERDHRAERVLHLHLANVLDGTTTAVGTIVVQTDGVLGAVRDVVCANLSAAVRGALDSGIGDEVVGASSGRVARRVLVPLARGCASAVSPGHACAGGVGLALHFVAVTLAGPGGAARELVFLRAGRSNTAVGAVRGREAERRDITVDHVAARRTGVRVREGGLVHDISAVDGALRARSLRNHDRALRSGGGVVGRVLAVVRDRVRVIDILDLAARGH